ncbi:MAG: TRAP transporter substrate-binding protein [Bacteroidales bacterium]|nr:TRAP transporter substrate-binding protein [Bacteroidales bacterium]
MKILRSSVLIFLVLLSAACMHDSKIEVLKLAHGLDTEHPVHKSMVYMAEILKEESGGSLTIDIYPSAQLGSERQCIELLQIGSLDITKVSASALEGFAPAYKVLSLPFIFDDREHSYEILDGNTGREILLSSEKYWLRGLTFYDAGSRSFYTKDRPVKHPDDLKGLSIRVMKSPTAIEMINSFGGNPTPISWGELYTSLQTGRVDAAENNPPSFFHSHHYEVCKYYCLDEHTSVPDVLLISTITWKQMDEKERKWLENAARRSSIYQRKLWIEDEKESMRQLEAAGVTIIPTEEIDREAFRKAVDGMYERASADPVVGHLIEKIKQSTEHEKNN